MNLCGIPTGRLLSAEIVVSLSEFQARVGEYNRRNDSKQRGRLRHIRRTLRTAR